MTAHLWTRMARGERGLVYMPPATVTTARRAPSLTRQAACGAAKLGISPETYREHVEAGERWCSGHQEWHAATLEIFSVERSAKSGLSASCRAWRKAQYAARQPRGAP